MGPLKRGPGYSSTKNRTKRGSPERVMVSDSKAPVVTDRGRPTGRGPCTIHRSSVSTLPPLITTVRLRKDPRPLNSSPGTSTDFMTLLVRRGHPCASADLCAQTLSSPTYGGRWGTSSFRPFSHPGHPGNPVFRITAVERTDLGPSASRTA